jgi:hypothetical protein
MERVKLVELGRGWRFEGELLRKGTLACLAVLGLILLTCHLGFGAESTAGAQSGAGGSLTWLRPVLRWVSTLLLASFMALSATSFYVVRLPKKRQEYNRILKLLGIPDSDDFYQEKLRNEYRPSDYLLPVAFATFVCLLGFYSMFREIDDSLKLPNVLLGGKFFADMEHTGQLEGYQRASQQALMWGFLGSYIWVVQTILRRLNVVDLSPGAYYGAAIRMIFAAFIALVFRFFQGTWTATSIPVVSFFIGMFPERALDYMKEKVKVVSTRNMVKSDDLPLDMIEGISIYHKMRLTEIGIDNAQNLAAANLVDLMLKTPFKSSELIDWIGQAKLYLYFKNDIAALREIGIRTVFDMRAVCGDHSRVAEIAKYLTKAHDKENQCDLYLGSVCKSMQADPSIEKLVHATEALEVM